MNDMKKFEDFLETLPITKNFTDVTALTLKLAYKRYCGEYISREEAENILIENNYKYRWSEGRQANVYKFSKKVRKM